MKKLFLSIVLLLTLSGCAIAQTEQKPVVRTVARVADIYADYATLDSGGKTNYRVPADELILAKEYVFWLEITDCGKCPTAKAVVLGHALTTQQAQKDQKNEAEKLSHRNIIQ
jgi:hypothetical protein